MNTRNFKLHEASFGKSFKFYLFVLAILFTVYNPIFAQDPCGLKQVMESMFAQYSNSQQQNSSSSNNSGGSCTGSYEIPLVFHVLHDNGPENIIDDQIFEAVEQLNNQFAGGEGGYNTNISFYIANVDPNGYCTNGINRIQTSTPGISSLDFNSDVAMKNLSRWPVSDYLNVWIVKYINGATGYSYLPPVASEVDGVVVHYEYLGTTEEASGNVTNTLAHEIGHYLNLYHVWGPDWGVDHCALKCDLSKPCDQNGDRVCDTQPFHHALITSNCDPYPSNCESCPNFPIGEYFYDKDNYMSYAHPCQDRFTEGQATRMCEAIVNYRSALPNSKKEGCNNDCVTIIKSNTTYNNPVSLSFGGDIRVQSGATLTISQTALHFAQGKSLYIENGGKLVLLKNAILNKCPQASYWNGVVVETGGELVAIQANIYNAKTGIRGNDDSKLDLNIVNIIGLNNTFGQGIYLENGINAVKLNRLKIENYDRGIDTWWGNATYEVTNSEINYVNIGIFMYKNTVLLSGTTIVSANTGIYLWESLGSSIDGNQIGYATTGFQSWKSPYTSIVNNTIGWPTQRGKNAIDLRLSGGSAISNNPQIQSTELGVRLFRSDALVDHNSIDVFGQNNKFGGGIKVDRSNGCQILQNYLDIDHSSFGIETAEAISTSINNNQIDHFSTVSTMTAGIRSMGSMDDFVEENVIQGVANTTGMIAQNSMANHYECNITNNTAEGLGVYYNSEEQEIKGNEFDAGIDLAIRSVVGLQPHHGNKFFGGSVRANELNLQERQASLFKANPNIPGLWPTDIQPNDGSWWLGEPNLTPYSCDGTFGPIWVPFGNDPNKICAYWTYLKSIQSTKPELFFIKLYHLLKYSKTMTGFNLPNCIKLDPVFQTLCGLTKLVDVSVALDKIGKTNTNTSTLTSLQSLYIQEPTEAGRTAIKNQIATEVQALAPTINAEQNQDSVRLDSIETELNTINCTQIIITKWKEILKLYVKFLRKGEVSQNDRTALLSYSVDCSDLYGDPIHLARAMANTFDDTYFDAYDGCLNEGGPRSRKETDQSEMINIYPNPTSGKVYLRLPLRYNGEAYVYNVDGRLMSAAKIVDSNINEIDLSEFSGMYYVQLRSIDGDMVSKKIIVLK